VVLSAVIFLLVSSVSAESVQGDINNNGVKDLKAFFKSKVLSHVELDRNEDGKIDAWFFFVSNKNDWDTRADYDEDYDGRVDEIYFIKSDEPIKALADKDLDGMLDLETTYRGGVPATEKRIEPPLDPARIQAQI
jgi:hypothetical protein